MLRNKFMGLCLIVLAQVIPSTAMSLPNDTLSVFAVSRNGTNVGYIESRLKYLGQTYEYSKFTQSTGLAKFLTKARVSEKSVGKFSGERLTPVSYTFDQKTRKKHVTEKARFTRNRASGLYKGSAYSVQTPANVLDRASLEVAVARDLKLNLPELQYNVMERGEIKPYIFAKIGNERLETGAGIFNTIKLLVKRKNQSRKTTYWMAKELGYLPVKMLHEEGNEVISSVISKYTIKP